MSSVNPVEFINAITSLIAAFTGFLTVLGGIFIAIRQHGIAKQVNAIHSEMKNGNDGH